MAADAEPTGDKPLDPEEVRKAFKALVTRLDARLGGVEEQVKRAQRLALSAESRADDCRMDCHAAEVKAHTCKLAGDSYWEFLQKALEDIVALRGRVRMLEDANRKDAGGGPDGGVEADGSGTPRPAE